MRGLSYRAFTLVELLVVITVISILAVLLMPVLAKGKQRAVGVKCMSQLREVGIAFGAFTTDHDGRFPMQSTWRDGGSLEYVPTGYVWPHFKTLSNILERTELLVCPADRVKYATNWANLTNANISYFVGVDARPGRVFHMLAGDRNITNHVPSPYGAFVLTTNSLVGWTRDIHQTSGNVLFADGHVSSLDDKELQKALTRHGAVQ